MPVIWVVIVLVVCVAVGPIFWLLPSERDRRLSELRMAARRAGLTVEMAALPKLDASAEERVSAGGVARDATLECAGYRLPLLAPLTGAPSWRLFKCASESRYLPGWTTLHPPVDLPPLAEGYWRRIGAIVDALPGGCVAVQADARAIVWFGRERLTGESSQVVVDGIREGLEAIAQVHRDVAESAP